MTSAIVLPRRSRAWPEPSTHLTASTMFVLPEPLGPTIAVTPPSNRISVVRANVLKPSRLSERRNKLPAIVADVGVDLASATTCGEALLDRFPELATPWFARDDHRFRFALRHGDDLSHFGYGL